MRSYDPDIEDQLDSGRIDRRLAVLFELGEGAYGFYSGGIGTISWGGVDYVGAGSLLSVKRGEVDTAKTQSPLEVTIASKYEVDGEVVELFSSGLLQGIEQLTYYRRPAIMGRFYISEAGQVIDFVQLARCEVFSIVHDEDEKNGYTITGVLNTVSAFRKMRDSKTRNKELQALIDPTDRGLDNIGVVTKDKVYWGARPKEDGTP